MKRIVFIGTLLCIVGLGTGLNAQTKTVKIKREKSLQGANEFIVTWEGEHYKSTYYEVKTILEGEPMVTQQVFLHQLQRISAIVKEPWTFEQLKALFESHGFAVVNKAEIGPADSHR